MLPGIGSTDACSSKPPALFACVRPGKPPRVAAIRTAKQVLPGEIARHSRPGVNGCLPGRLISPNSVTWTVVARPTACSCPATVGYRVGNADDIRIKIDFLPARHFQA